MVLLGVVALFVLYALPAMNAAPAAQEGTAIDLNVTLPEPVAAEPEAAAPAAEPAQAE